MSFSVCIYQKWFAVTKIKLRKILNESLENVYLSLDIAIIIEEDCGICYVKQLNFEKI